MNVNFETLCNCKPGDILYTSVISRNFIDVDKVKDKLVDNGYFERAIKFTCPHCNRMIFHSKMKNVKEYLNSDNAICTDCDKEIELKNLIPIAILVRTNKPYNSKNLSSVSTKLEWGYDYDRVCSALNNKQKEMFDNLYKETSSKVKISAKLPNGESITLDRPIEFTSIEITDTI